jgi:hypothetical protein
MADQRDPNLLPPDQLPDGTFDHEINIPAINKVLIALAITCIATFVLVVPLFKVLEEAPPDAPMSPFQAQVNQDAQLAPKPALQVSTTIDIERLRAEERAALDGYAWVEPGSVAKLPIDRAMAIVAERGVGVFEPPVEPATDEAGNEATP